MSKIGESTKKRSTGVLQFPRKSILSERVPEGEILPSPFILFQKIEDMRKVDLRVGMIREAFWSTAVLCRFS